MELNENLFKLTKETFGLKETVPNEVAPLILAYIGDAVFEIVVRNIIISQGNTAVDKIHKKTIKIVNAGTQARMIEAIEDILTETELGIYKRGKNAKSHTSSKNASLKDYHKATGYEALMGYLYLNNEYERMLELIKAGLERVMNIN